jgi:DNA processing protein
MSSDVESGKDYYWIWLQGVVKGVSFRDKLALLERYQDPGLIFAAPRTELQALGISNDVHQAFFNERMLDEAKEIQAGHRSLGIHHLLRSDPRFRGGDYFVLFYRGQLAVEPSAAVVGTRECSAHGYYYTQQICTDLMKRGYAINSGLRPGIEQWALRAALAAHRPTQVFLAHGLDSCYPREKSSLLTEIAEQGAVISPYIAGERPQRFHFVQRNALLAAWSDEVVVVEVETSDRSGALATAEEALRLGKPLWTVEPLARNERSAGNRRLLELGARPYHLVDGNALTDPMPDDELLRRLRLGPGTLDDLARTLNKQVADVEKRLLVLAMAHWVVFSSDGRYHYNG